METKKGKPYSPEEVLVQEGPNKGSITDEFVSARVVEAHKDSAQEVGQEVKRVGDLPVFAAESENRERYGLGERDDDYPTYSPEMADDAGLASAAEEVAQRAEASVTLVNPGVGHNLTENEINMLNARRRMPVGDPAFREFKAEQIRLSQERQAEQKEEQQEER